MANVKNNASAQVTCKLLMEAAGTVFAERGFHKATIKEITDRAGASLASVNYHFNDKAELYAAVIRAMICGCEGMVPAVATLSGTAEERLRQFIRHFLMALMSREERWWERVLMSREIAQPTAAIEPLIEQVVKPLSTAVADLAGEISGVRLSRETAALIASSVLGQCLHYADHQQVLDRLYPDLKLTANPGKVADHIARFSIAGIRAYAGKKQMVKRRKARAAVG